jgi:uncharacterized protein YndB with AHSA1/START domain
MTTTATREVTITADPNVPLVRIVREFDAPPDKVFRAHADPELVVQWLGPRAVTMKVESWDFRTGGSYRYSAIDSDGNPQSFRGCFHEVRPGAAIIQTFTWEGMPDGVALERLDLEDIGGGRTRLTATSLVDSMEGRDAMMMSGMDVGIREGYEKLDELLAG